MAEQVYLDQKDVASHWERRAEEIMFSSNSSNFAQDLQDLNKADEKWDRAERNANIASMAVNKHRADAAKK